MLGAKYETESLRQTPVFFFSNDKDELIFLMFHFLIWTSAWNRLNCYSCKLAWVPYCFKLSCCNQ